MALYCLTITTDRPFFNPQILAFFLFRLKNIIWLFIRNSRKNQMDAARIVMGTTGLASVASLRTETWLETLAYRSRNINYSYSLRWSLNFLLLIYHHVPPLVDANSVYNLWNANNFEAVLENSQLYNSFLPSVIQSWNAVSRETRDSVNITSFKRRLNANIVLSLVTWLLQCRQTSRPNIPCSGKNNIQVSQSTSLLKKKNKIK